MEAPPKGTVEAWAWDLVHTTDLVGKLSPPAPPSEWEAHAPPRRPLAPGRPPELRVVGRAPRSPRLGALRQAAARVRLLATLHHHEVQAAELFAWAVLAFPESPRRFRRALVALARDELAHAALYRGRLEAHGAGLEDHPVRDWFWERVPTCPDPTGFVALVGLGLEGGNLEHASRLAAGFEAGGDAETAAVCRRVAREEEAHVRLAARWFRRFTGGLDFDRWREALPSPLTPTVLAGTPLDREARARAGLDPRFLDQLEDWCRRPPGS